MELLMACLLLVCFYFLSKEAAYTSAKIIMEETEVDKKKEKILIDPGHGGMDPGMIGIGGAEEKKYNLEIANRVKKKLEQQGYQVIMSRTTDEGLYDSDSMTKKAQDLQRRIALIKKERPIAAVSIHQNSYEDSSVCGPQVFYYEDSVEGAKMAEFIQQSLNHVSGVLRQREKKGNKSYYLLKRSPSVTLIVECGFLTNPEEAKLLKKTEYQEKIATAIAEGIHAYLQDGSQS